MAESRSGPSRRADTSRQARGSRQTVASRRGVLAAGATLLGGALSGCAAMRAASGPSVEVTSSRPVSMLAAGSLHDALENGLKPGVRDAGVTLRAEARGSAAAARLVAEGQKHPDVVSVADPALFDAPLDPAWHAEFATNSLVVAYDPDSPGGRAVADAGPDRWYRPLLDDEASLGRTDPDLDPLGYRTLFALELATDFYDADADLRAAIPERGQVYPETQLVSQFETGSVDAAVTYRSMAADRGYAFVDLPSEIDLGDPSRADRYRKASYTLPSGTTVRGDAISYASTILSGSNDDAVRTAFEEHVTGDYLTDFGFAVPDDYPRFRGDVPDGLAD